MARATEWRWSLSVIDAYQPLASVKGWKKCPHCHEFPRVWVFDNGCSAKCCCSLDLYSTPNARSESIMSVYSRTGSCAEYSRDNLRLAWNEYVCTGVVIDWLSNGRW